MTKGSRVSRLLSVDASVLRGAGDKEGHSAHCTSVLNAILEICHRAVLCTDVQQEWNKHQSRISVKWRAAMNARKKLIPIDVKAESQRILSKVNSLTYVASAHKKALIKDVHLLAGAAHGDHVIVSGDKSLKDLCDVYLTEKVEWLLLSPNDDVVHREALLTRLVEMSKTRVSRK